MANPERPAGSRRASDSPAHPDNTETADPSKGPDATAGAADDIARLDDVEGAGSSEHTVVDNSVRERFARLQREQGLSPDAADQWACESAAGRAVPDSQQGGDLSRTVDLASILAATTPETSAISAAGLVGEVSSGARHEASGGAEHELDSQGPEDQALDEAPVGEASERDALEHEAPVDEAGERGAPTPAAPEHGTLDKEARQDEAPQQAEEVVAAAATPACDDPAQLGEAFPRDEPASGQTPTVKVAVDGRRSDPDLAVQRREATVPYVAPESGSAERRSGPHKAETAGSVLSAPQPSSGRHDPETANIEDAWASIDEQPSGWRSLTGESQVERKEQAEQPVRAKTNVFVLGSEVVPERGARLACLNGPEGGREFPLPREVTIGRATTCNIVITEASVSREHARVCREGDSYVVIDQTSGNGTFVNGQRVTRQQLSPGDRLALGHCELTFIAAGGTLEEPAGPGRHVDLAETVAAAASRSALTLPVLVSAVIVVVALLAATAILLSRRGSAAGSDTAFAYFQAGIAAFKSRDFATAQVQFEIFAGLAPANEHGRRYLEAVARERANAQSLEAARRLWQKRELAKAYAQAAALADSAYAPEASEIIRGIDVELGARLVRAKQALDAGRAAEATELVRDVLLVRPASVEAFELLSRAERARPAARDDTRPEPRAAGRGLLEPALARAIEQFADGAVDEALASAVDAPDSNNAKMLIAKINRFKQVYDGALEEHKAKRSAAALKQLEQARAFAGKILGERACKLNDEINRKVADMYYVDGIEAFNGETWAQAAQSFRAALAASPGHAQARKKLEELAQKALSIFAEGETLRLSDREQARARYQKVLQLARPSDEVHRKARQRLDEMP